MIDRFDPTRKSREGVNADGSQEDELVVPARVSATDSRQQEGLESVSVNGDGERVTADDLTDEKRVAQLPKVDPEKLSLPEPDTELLELAGINDARNVTVRDGRLTLRPEVLNILPGFNRNGQLSLNLLSYLGIKGLVRGEQFSSAFSLNTRRFGRHVGQGIRRVLRLSSVSSEEIEEVSSKLSFVVPKKEEIYTNEASFRKLYPTLRYEGDPRLTARLELGGLGTTGQGSWKLFEQRLRRQERVTLSRDHNYTTKGAYSSIMSIPETGTWAEAGSATVAGILRKVMAEVDYLFEVTGRPIDLFALSTGSPIAELIAFICPEKVRTLTPVSEARRLTSRTKQVAIEKALRFSRIEHLVTDSETGESRDVTADVLKVLSASFAEADPDPDDPEEYRQAPSYQFMPGNIFAILAELQELLEKIKPETFLTIPTLRIADPEDPLISYAAIEEAHRRSVPEFSQLIPIHGAKHNIMLGSKRYKFYEEIRNFRHSLYRVFDQAEDGNVSSTKAEAESDQGTAMSRELAALRKEARALSSPGSVEKFIEEYGLAG